MMMFFPPECQLAMTRTILMRKAFRVSTDIYHGTCVWYWCRIENLMGRCERIGILKERGGVGLVETVAAATRQDARWKAEKEPTGLGVRNYVIKIEWRK